MYVPVSMFRIKLTGLMIVKENTIALLRNEKNNLVRKAICGIISAIADLDVVKNQWVEIKDVIINV